VKNTHQELGIKVLPVAVAGAPFGMLNSYLKMDPERLHAQQPTALFKVNLPQSAAMGLPRERPVVGLAWADAKTPVAIFGFCLGKMYIAAAFNPVDPSTRSRLKEAMNSGKFTSIIEFNSSDPTKSYENIDMAYNGFPAAVLFEDALRATEGLAAIDPKVWRAAAAPTMLEWLAGQGLDLGLRKRVQFRGFCVVPTEPDGELSTGWEKVA